MIYIGLTGWGDHDDLYQFGVSSRDKLSVYSSHFPIVEVDSSFYAIQPATNYRKWVFETPDSFFFIRESLSRDDRAYSRRESLFKRKRNV